MTTEAKAAGASGGQGRSAEANRLQTHSTTAARPGQPVPIYLGGRVVCQVIDGVLRRRAGAGERLRKPPAWSFHSEVLEQARAAGARAIIVEDLESGLSYGAPLSLFEAKGFDLDRGRGRQRALVLRYWRINAQDSTPVPEAPSGTPELVQLALFGGVP